MCVLDSKQLEIIKNIDIAAIERDTLVDIKDVHINPSHATTQKMQSYFEQIKNPYCFLCGDTPVRIRFVSDEKTLSESIGNYFASLK